MPATPRYILRYPDPSDPAGFNTVGDQPIHLRSLAEDIEGTVGGVEDNLDAHAATPHGGTHPDLATHDTLGLATQAELDAAVMAADTNATDYTDTSVGAAVSNHNAAGATAHTGKPMMRVASSDGVFGVPGSVDIYIIPNAAWALPPLTGQPDGTLIFRAAS